MRFKGRFISAGDASRLNKLYRRQPICESAHGTGTDPQISTACQQSTERFRFGGRRIVELDYLVEQLTRGCWLCGSNLKVILCFVTNISLIGTI
jgi:hypothetical protein